MSYFWWNNQRVIFGLVISDKIKYVLAIFNLNLSYDTLQLQPSVISEWITTQWVIFELSMKTLLISVEITN